MQLRPCTACNRHVAIEATSCPFCAAALGVGSPAIDPARLSRAAIFVAGAAAAALGAASLGGCWTNKNTPAHAEQTPPPDAAVRAPDAAVVQQQQINVDDGQDVQNHPCFDGPQGPVCAPYGAPPARRRIV